MPLLDLLLEARLYIFGRLLCGLIAVGSVPLYLHWFGVEIYADYALSFFTANALSALCFGWVTQGYFREFSNVSIRLELKSVMLLIAALGFVGGWFLNALLLWGTAVSFALYSMQRLHFQAKKRDKRYVVKDLLRSAGLLIVPYGFVLSGEQNVASILWGVVVSNILFCDFSLFRRLSIFSAKVCRQAFIYGFPIAVWLAAGAGLVVLDRWFIEFYISKSFSGEYSAVYDLIVKGVGLVFLPLSNVVFSSVIVRGEHANVLQGWRYYFGVIILCALVATAAFLGVILFGLFELLPGFPSGISIVSGGLLVFGVVLWQGAMLFHKAMEQRRKTLIMVFFLLVSVMVHLLVIWSLVGKLAENVFPTALAFSAMTYVLCCVLYCLVFATEEEDVKEDAS